MNECGPRPQVDENYAKKCHLLCHMALNVGKKIKHKILVGRTGNWWVIACLQSSYLGDRDRRILV
jgi:hypothetical protein